MQKYEEFKKSITILCIEDEKDAGDKLVKILSKHFKEVILARNGEEALDIYKNSYTNKSIDLIISDINMPIMNGIELLEIIREFDENLPFIYVTARLDFDVLLKLVKLDIVNYLQKPLNVDELLTTVNKVVFSKYKSHFFNANHKVHLIHINENLNWDNDSKVLLFKNETVKLTKYEYLLVDFLLNNPNKVFTPDSLIDLIYEDSLNYSNTSNLRNLISRLRIKIPELNIENIYGLGYKIRIQVGKY